MKEELTQVLLLDEGNRDRIIASYGEKGWTLLGELPAHREDGEPIPTLLFWRMIQTPIQARKRVPKTDKWWTRFV